MRVLNRYFIKLLIFLIHYFVRVGFFIFIERKILGFRQYREGPNKVYLKGLIQFIYDIFKLLSKDYTTLLINYYFLIYLFCIFLFLTIILI